MKMFLMLSDNGIERRNVENKAFDHYDKITHTNRF